MPVEIAALTRGIDPMRTVWRILQRCFEQRRGIHVQQLYD